MNSTLPLHSVNIRNKLLFNKEEYHYYYNKGGHSLNPLGVDIFLCEEEVINTSPGILFKVTKNRLKF